jgi:hypothetical protein
MALTPNELEQLRDARALLENPSLAAKVTDIIGKPLERAMNLLPRQATETVHRAVNKALERALDVALSTSGSRPTASSRDRLHKLAGATSGAVGGFFGVAGLTVELPVTTVIMLRSIGDIARSEGHDLADGETRLACLEVFALGGTSTSDDAAETGYYAVRAAMASLISDAVQHVAARGAAARGTPVLVRLVDKIAARFGLVVQEKVALELFPVVGAASGALINTAFMDHFQSAARGHFIVRRLEKVHGVEAVRTAYLNL